jgi:hypothetical protein
LVDPDASAVDIADTVAEAAAAALEAGIFEPQRLRTEFPDTTRTFRRTRYSVIREVGEVVDHAPSQPLGKLLSDLAIDRGRAIVEIERFVRQAEQLLNASRERGLQQIATLRAGGGSESDLDALRHSLRELKAALDKANT